MKYLIIGDTHGLIDLKKVSESVLQLLDPEDIIIHCGDFGACWSGQLDEAYEFWTSLEQSVIICLGNHENYDWIKRQPVGIQYGGVGYQLADNLFAPLLGEILQVGDKSFWFYPGGYSVDFLYRTPNRSIWKDELATKQASDLAIERLEQTGGVDYVISHDGPRRFIINHWGYPIAGPKPTYYTLLGLSEDQVIHPGFALDQVYLQPQLWQRWFFGHHHRDDDKEGIRPLFRDIILVQDGEETIVE